MVEHGPDLLPCPFCGGVAAVFDVISRNCCQARCTRCWAATASASTWGIAAGLWNARPRPNTRVEPSAEDCRKFLEMHERLEEFETQQRDTATPFTAEEIASFPLVECVRVTEYLYAIAYASNTGE